MYRERRPERVGTLVIGAGQAGLSVGYHLARRKLPFLIVEARERVGDQWRSRWDSLRLFTSARFDSLDGMPFPSSPSYFPTKDEMADYLEAYARRFDLPVRTGTRVERLTRRDGRYVVDAGETCFEAENVVVAMADYQEPKVPAFAAELADDIVQLHSREYRNPGQLQDGDVLLVGAGNSGSEIAMELSRAGHRVWMSGRDTGHLPFRIARLPGRIFLVPLVLRFLFHRVLTVDTPIGRKVRPKALHRGGPLIRVMPKDLERAGVLRVGRTSGVRDGLPVLDDGRVLDVANVVWCTGFHPGFSWIDLPIFEDGEPVHEKGVVRAAPGLYFTGLHFLRALSSGMVHGAGRDAEYVVRQIAAREVAPLADARATEAEPAGRRAEIAARL